MISKRHRYDQGQYAILPREVINNSALTFEARGLLLYLLEKPVDWTVSNEALYRQSPAGERHINTILRELKAAGYVHREKVYDPPTRTFRWDTVVYDFPEDNPHFGRIPADRMDTKRRHTDRMDTKRGDDLILDPPILEEPIEEPPPAREAGPVIPEPEPVVAPPSPRPAPPTVIHAAADRTPGGMGYKLPPDAPIPVDYRTAQPTPELLARQHPAVAAYWAVVGRHPGRVNVDYVIERLGDTPDEAALKRAVAEWRLSGYEDKNIKGILEWYAEIHRDPAWQPVDRFRRKNGNGKVAKPPVPEIKVVDGLF